MKQMSVALVFGLCILLGVTVLLSPGGPETFMREILRAISLLVIFVGLCGVIVSLGWSIGTALRGANAHKAHPEKHVERIIERDGRIPHAPQILPMPGMFDAYPGSFRDAVADAAGEQATRNYQVEPPLMAQRAIEAPQEVDVFDVTGW